MSHVHSPEQCTSCKTYSMEEVKDPEQSPLLHRSAGGNLVLLGRSLLTGNFFSEKLFYYMLGLKMPGVRLR